MKLRITILKLVLVLPLLVSGQEQTGDFEGVRLPSEDTYQQIETLTDPSPGLRYGPPGSGGSANKETPLPTAGVNLTIILSLAGLSAIYVTQKKHRHTNTN